MELYRSQFTDAPAIEGHDWKAAQEALARARELTAQRGVHLALVIFPELHALAGDHPFASIYAQVARYAESIGVPAISRIHRKAADLTKAF